MFRECHKCPLNGTGSPECIECAGPAPVSYKGVCYVHPDGADAPDALYLGDRRRPSEEPYEGRELAIFNEGKENGALCAIQWLSDLETEDALLVLVALRGSFADAGRRTGTTRACWSKRWRELVCRMPELDAVVHGRSREAK